MKRKLFYTTLLVVLLSLIVTVGPAWAGEKWLRTPVAGASRCGAGFGANNPLGGQTFHNAVDMACGMYRAPVLAVASGEVVWNTYWPKGSASNMGHGITVIIKHTSGLYTYSAHLTEATVQIGQQIDQGSVVGYVGNTGYVISTPSNPNYHLHFAVRNTGPDDAICWDASCWLNPDNFLGKSPEIANPDPDDPKPNKFNLITTIDEIVAIIKHIPKFKDWDEKWEGIKGYIPYIPWVLAGLTLLVFLGLLWLIKPVLNWLTKSAWWRKRYHNVELFCLALCIKFFGKGDLDLYWAQMAQFAFAAWGFYFLEQIIERSYRHFNYDPDVEKDGPGKKEWLRKIINTMFNIMLIMSILAYSWGFFLMNSDFQELVDVWGWFNDPDQPDPPDLPSPPDPPNPPDPDPPDPDPTPKPPNIIIGGGVEINFDCNFNAIKAGLGPVQVGCDAHGLPKFLITWWNGQKFNFQIPLEIWMAALEAGNTPEQVLGIIAIASSESTGFTNYQTENPYGALGVWQFLPATYTAWAEPGYENPAYRTNIPIAAKAVGNMMRGGMNEIYLMDHSNFVSCFMGGNGCWTWNQHSAQADYAYRILFALKVAAGLK